MGTLGGSLGVAWGGSVGPSGRHGGPGTLERPLGLPGVILGTLGELLEELGAAMDPIFRFSRNAVFP